MRKEYDVYKEPIGNDAYQRYEETPFYEPEKTPLSTFSIDVDKASYANVRQMIQQGTRPNADAVRVEEFMNYFEYDYPTPTGTHPFGTHTELMACPWDKTHQLLKIGLQGKKQEYNTLAPANYVFLIDVSGSMGDENKLPLLKSAFKLFARSLRSVDKVSIVVYAGAAGLVLPTTSGSDKQKIIESLDKLEAGGSTAGGAGIQLAYKVAEEQFLKEGNNRVILASDGDFNVGVSDVSELEKIIIEKRKTGVYFTVLGFGMGNYKDDRMEKLANKGNGNYFYINDMKEANKVFGKEMTGTLFTIAKDVKLQVEFNPKYVAAYRLVGYDNRILNAEDFNDDTKDAGELGVGHSVTALYEIVPFGVKIKDGEIPMADTFRYQKRKIDGTNVGNSGELAYVKMRYKKPDGEKSILMETPISPIVTARASDDFRFVASVAGFAQILRNSKYKGDWTLNQIAETAQRAIKKDEGEYRKEFVELVRRYENLELQAKK